ncbi:hypothetical protein PILCRDRAFT_1527 [Piloderma croceum F 1598]|uniref:Uncharacterized protein n=1 Tax=Piloderma croceum (strain F 1598) TaxID=765440 RepID=A0A0C3G1N0_PILCF|nr:hypothetical protein PILCRDRAFT_1527 [Piloderma croceum F 1598]
MLPTQPGHGVKPFNGHWPLFHSDLVNQDAMATEWKWDMTPSEHLHDVVPKLAWGWESERGKETKSPGATPTPRRTLLLPAALRPLK